MKDIISYIVIFVFIGVLGFFINNIYKDALNYEKVYIQISKKKDINNNVEQKVQKVFAGFLGALLGQDVKPKKKIDKLQIKKQKIQNSIETNIKYYMAIIIFSLFLFFIIKKTIFLLYLNLLALINLIYGVITPIFLVYIQKELPLMGNVMLQFESNTIISSIDKLLTQEKYFVGIVIFVFSILFPIIKTLLMILSSFVKNKLLYNITKYTSILSKWSMTDVFVLSIFLVYLSGGKGGMIHSQIESGYYFFFAYVILSLISSMVFIKIKKENI